MSEPFLRDLCAAVTAPRLITGASQRELIDRAIADTLGCAAAGFHEPVTRNALRAYGGDAAPTWSGEGCDSAESAVMVDAIAAHALDFDDVYLESLAHLSAVLVPVILRAGAGAAPDAVREAYAAGMIAAKAVARRVGRGHYGKGWHGTGTMGAFGAAAAAGRMHGLDAAGMEAAFALAAAMSGGLRVNFSTQAKPAHAGFAAAAGLRAARLAAAGVTGSGEIFSERGYPGLYGTGDGEVEPGPEAFEPRPDLVSVKLYPCCYATHRLVGVALAAREAMQAEVTGQGAAYLLEAPAGSFDGLVAGRPRTGLEAKFSPLYCLAVSLAGGAPTLAQFSDAAVDRPEVVSVMERTRLVEDADQPSGGDIAFGEVRLTVTGPSGAARTFVRRTLPGSPDDPPGREALVAKLGGCLAVFEAAAGRPFPMIGEAERLGIGGWLGADEGGRRPADEKEWTVEP